MGQLPEIIAKNESLRAALGRSEQMIQLLKEELALLRSKTFGRSSERLSPDQLKLFTDDSNTVVESAEVETEVVKEHTRKKKGHGRQSFPAHLERADWVCDLAESDKRCDVCEAELRAIGEDVRERGHLVPAHVIVNRYFKRKHACPQGHCVKTADAPAA